ncbi:DUF397 domain-containing protein [Streptomyces sp. XM4193]|uniref:DUF397 domain-containing protein n=1 Tax=Streptomyces sp. XM4193 TaxID=2929782 RepID=UPI001FFAF105|nr:DUF397 domain-containing protein [Streptomyces sp. XM4193]MCK1794495.1 DUF397 domain-containing protein [Streptomyces sp. XM4193]
MIANTESDWIKSSYSGNGGGNCLEWAPATAATGIVPVRDSKDIRRPGLTVDTHAWTIFIEHLKSH